MGGQPVLQIAVNDGGDGSPDAVDARHQCAARDDADQQAGDAQHRHRGRQSVPESGLQRLKQRVIPADEQLIAAENGDMHECLLIAVLPTSTRIV